MKKSTLSLGSIVLAAGLTLSACGANEEDLAKEYCDLAEKSIEAAESGDTEQAQEAAEELADWGEDNKDTTGDGEKFLEAVENECPDLGVSLP